MITDSLGLVALAMGAGAGSNPTLTRTGKLSRMIDWLGSARRQNEAINDEMETLKFENQVLRYANKHLRAENAKLRTYQDTLIEQIGKASIRCEWLEDANEKYERGLASAQDRIKFLEYQLAARPMSLIAYALKRKASLAKHDKKRGRG